ncbi:MAG: HD domain-containing protein, partial [Candidatus Peribacteraceae bacterium]|nr:HD domain-containing protein [Candidatus Peribacteraceae bacterium]
MFHTDSLDSSLRHLRPSNCALFTVHFDPVEPQLRPAAPLTMGQYLFFREAIAFARRAHHGQKRLDGRAFLSHPLAVLQILLTTSPDLPHNAYVASLLHDTIEDGCACHKEISGAFGQEVADVVLALSRPRRTGKSTDADREARYIRQMTEANARYPYVLLIKLADRLHNLETAHFLPREKRVTLREETAELY